MADINLNNLDGIPFGINSGRPANPQPGQPYFNGESNRLEIYTQTVGWQNIVQETPAVVNVVGSAKESTSSTITINGTNFAVGCIAYAVGTNGIEYQATTTSLISVVQLTATFPQLSLTYEPYDIKVVNPSNLYGVLYDALNVDANPVWTTGSGSLGTYAEQSAMSVQVSATDASDPSSSALIYSISSGALPNGLSINSSTGVISGTPANLTTNTTYSFTASAYDGYNPAVTRNFSITITDRGPTWVTAATLPTFTRNSAYSTTLVATDEDNVATISYSLFSGSLPTGLTLASNGVISGTPTSSSPTTFTIRATDSVSGSYTDRQFTIPNAGPVWVTSTTLSNAIQNIAYSVQLSATDDSGVAPAYSLVSGSFPTGISLSSTGLISGTTSLNSGTYSPVIRATDANGVFADRTFSITASPPPTGGTLYQTPGTYSWVAPANVYSVCVVGVGGGGGAGSDESAGGGGGGLGWRNNIAVTPGSTYTVVVGSGGAAAPAAGTQGSNGGDSYFINNSTVVGYGGGGGQTTTGAGGFGGSYVGGGGGQGGAGGNGVANDSGQNIGGGGAGGYAGNGGRGADYNTNNQTAGSGGGGGGGANGGPGEPGGGGGGGVGLYGQGADGYAGSPGSTSTGGGGGGSGGANGTSNGASTDVRAHGGAFGGGGGCDDLTPNGDGGKGGLRIIWGSGRSFPSTNTSQNFGGVAETVI